jgi:hypothetical protein
VSAPKQPAKQLKHHLTIWGAPGSGKTTFLGALQLALLRKNGPWSVFGNDPDSRDFLTRLTNALSAGGRFPEATSAQAHYHWSLAGPNQRSRRFWKKTPSHVKIGLDVLDASGRDFDPHQAIKDNRKSLLDNLIRSRGIVFLFDPIRDHEEGDTFKYLIGVLNDLAGVMMGTETEENRDGKLPHYLAVCITKFDEPKVLATAAQLKLLATDPADESRTPLVDDDDAKVLLEALCSALGGSAELVIPALQQFFHKDRTKFFATSSIGFYIDPNKGAWDKEDFQNIRLDGRYSTESSAPLNKIPIVIRDEIRPINVMEPVLWLGRKMAKVEPSRKDKT